MGSQQQASHTPPMPTSHPGCFFGITAYGSDSYFEDNSLSIYNQTMSLDKWHAAFKKCDYDNSNSVEREDLPVVVQHLYWGRVPAAEEIDSFMLHFDHQGEAKVSWDEFVECLNNFRQAQPPEGVAHTVTEFGSGERFRRKWTDIAQYGDCVDRNNQGRTIASDMSPSMKKCMHDAQGSSIMIL